MLDIFKFFLIRGTVAFTPKCKISVYINTTFYRHKNKRMFSKFLKCILLKEMYTPELRSVWTGFFFTNIISCTVPHYIFSILQTMCQLLFSFSVTTYTLFLNSSCAVVFSVYQPLSCLLRFNPATIAIAGCSHLSFLSLYNTTQFCIGIMGGILVNTSEIEHCTGFFSKNSKEIHESISVLFFEIQNLPNST